ncbi:MAG: molybdate ABC transporter substrate-binding protein [Dehalococcoidia bacterium]
MRVDRFLWAAATLMMLVGCSAPPPTGSAGPTVQTPASPGAPQPPSAPPPLSGELTVFAASSLTEAFDEIAAAFQAANPQARVVLNFGGSPQLRTQIEQGAFADVFASANIEQMDLAVKNGVISGTPVPFASNKLVVVTPKDNPGKIQSLNDLARPNLKIVLAQKDVPVGAYARDSIARMAADPTFGSSFADGVGRNIVSEEPNVRQVLAKVQLGEADAAVVYATDLTPQTAGSVKQIPIPDRFNVIALYPIAQVRESKRADLAQAFITFVAGPSGQAILKKWGFPAAP